MCLFPLNACSLKTGGDISKAGGHALHNTSKPSVSRSACCCVKQLGKPLDQTQHAKLTSNTIGRSTSDCMQDHLGQTWNTCLGWDAHHTPSDKAHPASCVPSCPTATTNIPKPHHSIDHRAAMPFPVQAHSLRKRELPNTQKHKHHAFPCASEHHKSLNCNWQCMPGRTCN